jgi:DNA-binding IclR family transcriptional regulator
VNSLSEISPEDDKHASGTQSISRAVALMRLLGSGPTGGISLSELVEGSGLVKPTCRRILVALIEAGLAEQDATTRRYFLGQEAYILGTIAAERHGNHHLSLEGVTRLAQATGDTAFIQVKRGFSVVCLHREDGAYPIRSHVLAAGDRHPLGAGAGGLALLAALSDQEVERAIAANADTLMKNYPALNRTILLDLVSETRAAGYSLNRGLLFPGSWGMAMVVRNQHGHPEACLSVAAIESRMQPDRQPQLAAALAEEVQRAQQRIAKSGYKKDTELNLIAQPIRRVATQRR